MIDDLMRVLNCSLRTCSRVFVFSFEDLLFPRYFASKLFKLGADQSPVICQKKKVFHESPSPISTGSHFLYSDCGLRSESAAPESFDSLLTNAEGASILTHAGVRTGLVVDDNSASDGYLRCEKMFWSPYKEINRRCCVDICRNLRWEAGKALARGLTSDEALVCCGLVSKRSHSQDRVTLHHWRHVKKIRRTEGVLLATPAHSDSPSSHTFYYLV